MTKTTPNLTCLVMIIFTAVLAIAEEQNQSLKQKLASEITAANDDEERTHLLEGSKSLISPELDNAIIKEADAIRLRGEYDKALSVFDFVIRIAEQINDRAGIAQAYNSIVIVYYFRSDYVRAAEFSKKSLAISEELQDKAGIANALNNFGLISDEQGNYDEALEYHRKSLALRTEVGDKRKIGFTLVNIGSINNSQGDYKQALDHFNEALKLFEELDDKASSATALNNLGTVYDRLGNFSLALEYCDKSLKLREALGLKPGIASVLANIGLLNFHEGNYDAALDSLKKALSIKEELKEKKNIANEMTNIGDVYQAMKDYSLAMNYYERSLNLREELSDKEGIGETLNAIGKIYYSQNKTDQAREYFQKSLAVNESIQDKEGIAVSLLSLAELNYSEQKYSESLELADKVATTSRQLNLRDTLWQARTIAGKSYDSLGKGGQAEEAFEEAIHSIESLRTEVVGDEPERQSFLEDKLAPYHFLVGLQVNQEKLDAALAYAERAKARILADLLKSGKVDITKNLTPAEQQEERNRKNQLVSCNTQLLREKQQDQSNENRIAELNANLQKAHLDYESFRRNLFTAHPELRVQRGEAEPVLLQDAISMLPDSKSAFLEFVVTDTKTFLFVLTQGNQSSPLLKVYTLPVKELDLAETTKRFRQEIANREASFRKSAKEIYQLLIQPAAMQLKDLSELIIIPDGVLWELPFQALVNDEDQYLLQEFTISYVPSITVLREMKKLKTLTPLDEQQQLLAFGNPTTETKTTQRLHSPHRGGKLELLPETEKEVKILGRLYGPQSKVYFGSEAQEARFKSESEQYQLLHLAMHGILNDVTPMYSQIVFALNGTDDVEDGLLEAWEIMNLNLKAKLVVLSACDTALGRIRKGEGMIGLTWAFFVAGTPATVVSQWKVESASTTELMLEFHKKLIHERSVENPHSSKAEALRSAALKLMENIQYRHPFFWAPFVLIGDGS